MRCGWRRVCVYNALVVVVPMVGRRFARFVGWSVMHSMLSDGRVLAGF